MPENGRVYPHIPKHLLTIVQDEFTQDSIYDLFDELFGYPDYRRQQTKKLIDIAKDQSLYSWNMRMMAILMLENQIVKIPLTSGDEFEFLFTQLSIQSTDGDQSQLNASILNEGYTTTSLTEFVVEFRRRLARSHRIHERIQGERTSESGLRDFIAYSRQPCQLTLARYLVTPEDVVEQIRTPLYRTRGVSKDTHDDAPHMVSEAAHRLAHMPGYERRILQLLRETSNIYWVSEATSSALQGLVEYPLTTAVLVVKPPGSDLELELKRAGMRGDHPLQAVFVRDGRMIPIPHRLYGGSIGRILTWEAHAASRFALMYRTVHGTEAPLSLPVSVAAIYGVPIAGNEAHIMDYFTDAQTFGEGFEAMRTAMAQAVDAFSREYDTTSPDHLEGANLTVQFLRYTAPSQAILAGSSSFRLDQLVRYLSPQGPHLYFTAGLGIAYTASEAQRFADTLLDEILGIYLPPPMPYRDHADYVQAALAVPANRIRADRHYLAAMRQIGLIWGTLLAVRGYSHGESFVSRNVGLKSTWEDGQWQVKLVFMDHDNLHVMGTASEPFRPSTVLNAMRLDEAYIHTLTELPNMPPRPGETGALEAIYHVGEPLRPQGHKALRQAMIAAHHRTRHALVQVPILQGIFAPSTMRVIQDWDTIVSRYLAARQNPSQVADWRVDSRCALSAKAYDDAFIHEVLNSIEQSDAFLTRYPFLY